MTRVLVFTDQPVLALGFQQTLAGADLQVTSICDLEGDCTQIFKNAEPNVVLLDLTGEFTFDTLAELHERLTGSSIVIRVGPMSRELIFQALEYGVRGILPVQLSPEALVSSLRRIAAGEVLIEVTDAGFDSPGEKRVTFSDRERQVVDLLGQGLKNKEIAAAMNLAEGTVKVYLSRLFKKTKVRDRFELMLYRAHDRKLLNPSDNRTRDGAPTPGAVALADYPASTPVQPQTRIAV